MSATTRRPLSGVRIGVALLLIFFAGRGVLLILAQGPSTPALPADAYFYLSKAENLIAGRGLTTYWNEGLDRKFFPLHSVVLAPFSLLKPAVPAYWVITEGLYFLLTAAVLWLLVRRVEPSGEVAVFALLLWLANPNVILWHSVPYAEGLATLLAWGAVLVSLPDWRTCGLARFCAAALLAGLALATRAEAAFLPLVVFASLLIGLRRQHPSGASVRRLALGSAILLLPLGLWLLSLPPAEGTVRISYLEEFQGRFDARQIVANFRVLADSLLFEANIRPQPAWRAITLIAASRFFLVLTGLMLAGAAGPRGRWLVLVLTAYLFGHALWHYAYGRFNLMILPLVVYVFALGVHRISFSSGRLAGSLALILAADLASVTGEWAVRLSPLLLIGAGIALEMTCRALGSRSTRALSYPGLVRTARILRPIAAGGFVLAVALVMANIGTHAILRHNQFMISDDARTRARPAWAEAIISRIDSSTACMIPVDFPLAYRIGTMTGRKVWYSGGLPDFFPPAFDPAHTADFLDERGIRYILSYDPPDVWAREFRLSAADARRLVLRRNFERGILLEWRSPGD